MSLLNQLYRHLLGLPPQATTFARHLDYLHYVVITTALLGTLWITFRVVRSLIAPGTKRAPLTRRTAVLEFGGLFALFLVFWVVGFIQYVDAREPPPDAAPIYVVAKQWMWEFAYPDGTATQGDLRVPVGRPVVLDLTSRDVIHSFYVPAFREKEDAVPGRVTTLWFTPTQVGTFDIECAEYCGTDHSQMLGHVIVMTPDDYAAWLAGATDDPTNLAQRGQDVAAEKGCLRCHTTDGSPHLGPTWKGLYGSTVRFADGTSGVADDAYLTRSMMEPQAQIVEGFTPIMPPYQGLLDPGEAAALVEYIRSLR